MKILAIEPRDIHFVLDFSLEDLKLLNQVSGALVAKPTFKEEEEQALQYFEWFLQQIKKMLEEVPEESDVKPTIKRVQL